MGVGFIGALKGRMPLMPNKYWTGEKFDKLVEGPVIQDYVQKQIEGLGIADRVVSVELFGSMNTFRGRKRIGRDPNDIDLYFRVDNYDFDLSRLIHDLFVTGEVPRPYGLRMNPVIGDTPILECPDLPMTTSYTRLYP